MKKLINVKELSEYTGICESTLYTWVHQKRIPFVKIGRLVRFEISAIDRFIESLQKESADSSEK